MQLSKQTIKLLYRELSEMEKHFDLTEQQHDEISELMNGLRLLHYGEPLEITLADE
jgi:hypothetical protein